MNLSQARIGFIDFKLHVRGIAATSAKTYDSHLLSFEAQAGPGTALGAAGAAIEPFLLTLGRRGLSDHHRAKAVNVLGQMFRWALERGHAKKDPLRDIPAPKIHRRRKVFLKRGQVAGLLAAIRREGRLHAERDYALFSTIFYGLLRVSEACRLRPEDVDLEAGVLRVLGKGGKAAALPICDKLARVLGRWMPKRPRSSGYLFPSHAAGWENTGQLDAARVEHVLREIYAPAAGLTDLVTPHTLRRSAANILRNAGSSLEEVKLLLRHSRIETTMLYLEEADPESLREVVGRL